MLLLGGTLFRFFYSRSEVCCEQGGARGKYAVILRGPRSVQMTLGRPFGPCSVRSSHIVAWGGVPLVVSLSWCSFRGVYPVWYTGDDSRRFPRCDVDLREGKVSSDNDYMANDMGVMEVNSLHTEGHALDGSWSRYEWSRLRLGGFNYSCARVCLACTFSGVCCLCLHMNLCRVCVGVCRSKRQTRFSRVILAFCRRSSVPFSVGRIARCPLHNFHGGYFWFEYFFELKLLKGDQRNPL